MMAHGSIMFKDEDEGREFLLLIRHYRSAIARFGSTNIEVAKGA